jgi:AcrR family transcriptional regulator
MGTIERREREKTEVRQKILDAARELFVTEGYEAVSMRKVAERIEYSATAIYSYFEDKAALLRALCDHDFAALANEFVEIAAEPDALERMRQSGRAYVRFGLAHPHAYQLMFMTPLPAMDPAESAVRKGDPSSDAYAFLELNVAELMKSGRLRPELTDVALVAQALWGSLHGIVALHVVRKNDPWMDWRDAEATAELIMQGLLRGLVRDPNAVGPVAASTARKTATKTKAKKRS